jgi:hypothetical protein
MGTAVPATSDTHRAAACCVPGQRRTAGRLPAGSGSHNAKLGAAAGNDRTSDFGSRAAATGATTNRWLRDRNGQDPRTGRSTRAPSTVRTDAPSSTQDRGRNVPEPPYVTEPRRTRPAPTDGPASAAAWVPKSASRPGRRRTAPRPSPVPRTRTLDDRRSAPAVDQVPASPTIPASTPRTTSSATWSSVRSTSSRATAPSPPATTSATSCSAEPSTSPQYGSGSATPSHDPRDRL